MFKRYVSTLATGFLLSGVFLFQGCDTNEEAIPSYIKINSINLSVNPVSEGTGSNKITDAWVYCDGDLVGVYELPCTFPLLEEPGEHDFIIKAGIKINGISASRGYYPFYVPVEQRLNLVPGETIELNPTVTYYPGKVQYIEAFEDGGVSLEPLGISDTGIVKTSNPSEVFEGAYSGIINLNSAIDYVFIGTSNAYDFPKDGTAVFLEMNYKTSNPLAIGLIAITSGGSAVNQIITLNPTEGWNKIYINLTSCISNNQDATSFKLYLEANKNVGLSEATILLDNLKLVYNE